MSKWINTNELFVIILILIVITTALAFFIANFGYQTKPKNLSSFKSVSQTYQPFIAPTMNVEVAPAVNPCYSSVCRNLY